MWEEVKKVFPGILKEPVGEDRWIDKGEYYITVHSRKRVTKVRGRMPQTRSRSEPISIMRTNGPIFVLGGDFEVGSRTKLREWTGYGMFKKAEETPKAQERVLSWE